MGLERLSLGARLYSSFESDARDTVAYRSFIAKAITDLDGGFPRSADVGKKCQPTRKARLNKIGFVWNENTGASQARTPRNRKNEALGPELRSLLMPGKQEATKTSGGLSPCIRKLEAASFAGKARLIISITGSQSASLIDVKNARLARSSAARMKSAEAPAREVGV